MWRETNLFGILLPPLLGYALVAFVLALLIRAALFRTPLARWFGNLALAQMTLYLGILAALVTWL